MKTYSPRLEQALRTAFRLHEGQRRKSDPTLPYTTHLVHVACIVAAHDFDEDVIIAALLHDSIEDTAYTAEELAADFGDEVYRIVMEVTENKALRWEARKSAYIEGVRGASPQGKAVCCADKIHNLSSILEAERQQGEALWGVFSRGRDRTLRFYEDVLDAIAHGWSHPMLEVYRAVVHKSRGRAAAPGNHNNESKHQL
ncbi:MAG: HD domain-containing protein [Bacteroidia bacterium]|nr:HD domain-containing protein [Bacteroidia bacterium]